MKIYPNQNVNVEQVIPFPDEVHTTDQEWWMIYDADTRVIVIEPLQGTALQIAAPVEADNPTGRGSVNVNCTESLQPFASVTRIE